MIINNLLSGDINTICIIMLFFGAIIIAFAKGLKKLISQDKKKTILYLLITIVAFASLSVFSIENSVSNRFMPNYITLQVFALLFGILHIVGLNKMFKWEEQNLWLAQLLFSIITVVVGSIVFIQISGRFGITGLHYFFLTGTFTFMLPWLFIRLFNNAMLIPLAVYKTWKYPVNKTYTQPQREELKNPHLIKLEIIKNSKDVGYSKIMVKAPEGMEFGQFFYHFINDYNQKHPESTIEYSTERNPHDWIFYKRPRFIGRWKQINIDQTIKRNSIRENHRVVCERV